MYCRAARGGSPEAIMALGFAGSIGRGPIELDCSSALSYYRNVIENQARNAIESVGVGCLAAGECHSLVHGSKHHWILLPRAPIDSHQYEPIQCALSHLSKWQGAAADCTSSSASSAEDCTLFERAVQCVSSDSGSFSSLMVQGFCQATGRGVAPNLTEAALLFDKAHHVSEAGSAEALFNQAMLAQHQQVLQTGALTTRHVAPGTQQRARALQLLVDSLLSRAAAVALRTQMPTAALVESQLALQMGSAECQQTLRKLKQAAERVASVAAKVELAHELERQGAESLMHWLEAAEQGVAKAQCKAAAQLEEIEPVRAMSMWSMAAQQGAPCGTLQLATVILGAASNSISDKLSLSQDNHVSSLLCSVLCGPHAPLEGEKVAARALVQQLLSSTSVEGNSRSCNSSLTACAIGDGDDVTDASAASFRWTVLLLLCGLLIGAYSKLHHDSKLKIKVAGLSSSEPSPYNSPCPSPSPSPSCHLPKPQAEPAENRKKNRKQVSKKEQQQLKQAAAAAEVSKKEQAAAAAIAKEVAYNEALRKAQADRAKAMIAAEAEATVAAVAAAEAAEAAEAEAAVEAEVAAAPAEVSPGSYHGINWTMHDYEDEATNSECNTELSPSTAAFRERLRIETADIAAAAENGMCELSSHISGSTLTVSPLTVTPGSAAEERKFETTDDVESWLESRETTMNMMLGRMELLEGSLDDLATATGGPKHGPSSIMVPNDTCLLQSKQMCASNDCHNAAAMEDDSSGEAYCLECWRKYMRERHSELQRQKPDEATAKQGAPNSSKQEEPQKPGDWNCSECANLNFAFRTECNKCSAPKDSAVQQAADSQESQQTQSLQPSQISAEAKAKQCDTEGCNSSQGLLEDDTCGLSFCAACWADYLDEEEAVEEAEEVEAATDNGFWDEEEAVEEAEEGEAATDDGFQNPGMLGSTCAALSEASEAPEQLSEHAAQTGTQQGTITSTPSPKPKAQQAPIPKAKQAPVPKDKQQRLPNEQAKLPVPQQPAVKQAVAKKPKAPKPQKAVSSVQEVADFPTVQPEIKSKAPKADPVKAVTAKTQNIRPEPQKDDAAEMAQALLTLSAAAKDCGSEAVMQAMRQLGDATDGQQAELAGAKLGSAMCEAASSVGWAVFDTLISGLATVASGKHVNACLGILAVQTQLAEGGDQLIEPYCLAMLLPLMEDTGALSSKRKPVRLAAAKLLISIVSHMNVHAVSLALPSLFEGASSRKWETQHAALEALKTLAVTKTVGVSRCLQELIPAVSDQMISSKAEVASLARSTMEAISITSANNDLEPFVDQIIASVLSPDEVTNCVNALASTVFVQKVEAPALALVEPLLMRGLKEKKIAMKRKVASIVDNMTKLIDNPGEAAPFLGRVLPGLQRALEELTDAEAQGVTQRAIKELEMAKKDMADFNALSPEAVLAVFHRECCYMDVVDLDAQLMEYVAGMCASLISARVFNEKEWVEAVVPYLSSFTAPAKAEKLCKLVLKACAKEARPINAQEDVHEEGEDLCNCEFTLGYAAKILLSNTRLHLKRGKRYGLCGPNDCGKSTLLRSIANGQLEGFPPADELKAVYLEHDIQGATMEVMVADYVFLDPDVAAMYDVNSETDRMHVCEVLESVGFSRDDVAKGASQKMQVTALSGGWKMILALARAMLAKADIMLLDEPTNHLDVDKVAWIKNYLVSPELENVTSIIVSHDSGFMDDVCTHIIHFEERKLKTYIGNLRDFVDKVPSAKAYYEFKSDRLKFVFPNPTALEGIKSKGRPILSMTNVSFTYPGATKQVLKDVSVKCTLNSRIAVIGPNGAGKSTAIKVLTGENPPTTGTTWKHPQMRFAYVAQHAFHHLEDHVGKTPVEYILWRYQAGFDKELAARGGAQISKAEAEAMKQPIIVKVEEGAKLVEKKRVVERFCSRRKQKASYAYEVKFQGLSHDHNQWLLREKLDSLGFAKMLVLCDEEENSRMGASRPLTHKFVLEQLEELGLEEEYAAHVHISNLSGGQKVKVVLAAAMWGGPHLIILDEPTNYLDRDSLAALAGAIKEFEGGVLIISHNRDFVEHVCKTLWIMSDGRLRAEGEDDLDEKIVEDLQEEDTIDHMGNVVKGRKKELNPQEIKRLKKVINAKIKADEELDDDEINFCIEHNL